MNKHTSVILRDDYFESKSSSPPADKISSINNSSGSSNTNISELIQQGTIESSLSPPASISAPSSSSSPSSSSGSDSSSDLDPNDALQSPLTGLLNFEGFSMPQIKDFGIANIDIPQLPSLAAFSSNFQRLPNLSNLSNLPSLQEGLSNLTTFASLPTLPNLRTLPNIPLFLPNLPTLPNLSTFSPHLPLLPNFPALPNYIQTNITQFRNSQNLVDFQYVLSLFKISKDFPVWQLFTRNSLMKPWTQHKICVRNIHLRLNDIIKACPSCFHIQERIARNATNVTRIYFLMNDAIHFCDINPQVTTENKTKSTQLSLSSSPRDLNSRLHPKPVHPRQLLHSSFGGLKTFEFHKTHSRFVFTLEDNFYYFDDKPAKSELLPFIPNPIPTSLSAKKSHPKICPSNPDLVSFLCLGNIWCINLRTYQELNLTNIIHGDINPLIRCSRLDDVLQSKFNYESASIIVGKPAHMIELEFKRDYGYLWCPEIINCNEENFCQYKIIYEETDQSSTEIINLPRWDGAIEQHRFSRPGYPNAKSKLRLLTFKQFKDSQQISDVEIVDLNTKYLEEFEYLVRFGWLGNETIWYQLLNRSQNHLVLVITSITNSFETQILYEECCDSFWIFPHDSIRFLGINDYNTKPLAPSRIVSFIWSSQESGFRHLYMIKVELSGNRYKSKLISKLQLTDGNWEVDDKDIWVDENKELLYFCGHRDSPLEKHLYVLSFGKRGAKNFNGFPRITKLTESNYSHEIVGFNETRSLFINTQSNISNPPVGYINLIDSNLKRPRSSRLSLNLFSSHSYPVTLFEKTTHFEYLNTIGNNPTIIHDPQPDLLPGLVKPELFCCKLRSGETIFGSVFKPEFMESGVKYPCVLEVYGGPQMQLVTNSFVSLRQPSRHLLASEGYVVVLIDSRGSGKRGVCFEGHNYWRLGQAELGDQVEILNWLAENTLYIDLERIAILGWSYGGFLALMALTQYPHVFKVAIAGAPVTDWHCYESAYTERFMGLPSENQEGYSKASILNKIHLFPDDSNRLLILHGLMDENVHFSHTLKLIKALIDDGKPYDLQVFPTERHVIKETVCRVNYMANILSYLQVNL